MVGGGGRKERKKLGEGLSWDLPCQENSLFLAEVI